MSNMNFKVTFGRTARPIRQQLPMLKVKDARAIQKCADAINTLADHNVLSEDSVFLLRRRLAKKVADCISLGNSKNLINLVRVERGAR